MVSEMQSVKYIIKITKILYLCFSNNFISL